MCSSFYLEVAWSIPKRHSNPEKIIHDENSGQPGIQRRKYYALNQRVQAVAQNYESYSDKIKYLKYIVNLWNTIITGGQDDV